MKAKSTLALLLAPLFFAGCSGEEVSVDERLVAAFVDVRVAEQTYGLESPTGRLARKAALEKHGYTRETFVAACDAVLADEFAWVPFQKAVTDRIDSMLGIPKPAPAKDAKKAKK